MVSAPAGAAVGLAFALPATLVARVALGGLVAERRAERTGRAGG